MTTRAIKFQTPNECDATETTANYTFLFLLTTIECTLGERIRTIAEDPEFIDLFLKRCFPYNHKIIFRYGNNMESTFHVREGEGNHELRITKATPRILSINAMIDNVVMCSKSRLSTIYFTSKTITLQDRPI